MNIKERVDFVDKKVSEILIPILQQKGRDYIDFAKGEIDANANANFESVSLFLGGGAIDKYVVLLVYLSKHLLAIMSWIRTKKVESEPIGMRIADAINYLFILWSMIEEDEMQGQLDALVDLKLKETDTQIIKTDLCNDINDLLIQHRKYK